VRMHLPVGQVHLAGKDGTRRPSAKSCRASIVLQNSGVTAMVATAPERARQTDVDSRSNEGMGSRIAATDDGPIGRCPE
jgi:hypothetical protein